MIRVKFFRQCVFKLLVFAACIGCPSIGELLFSRQGALFPLVTLRDGHAPALAQAADNLFQVGNPRFR